MNTNTSSHLPENSLEVDIEIDEELDPELFAFLERIPEEERAAALIALVEIGVKYRRSLTENVRQNSVEP